MKTKEKNGVQILEADAPEILAIKVSEWKALERVNVFKAHQKAYLMSVVAFLFDFSVLITKINI